MAPSDVGQPPGVGRAVVRALPRGLRCQVEYAEAGDLPGVVGPALEMLALFTHGHGRAPSNCQRTFWRRRGLARTRQPQPIEPSIWSSMSRLHSTAYSIGSVRVMGSMKPFTIMPIAWVSDRPRLMR